MRLNSWFISSSEILSSLKALLISLNWRVPELSVSKVRKAFLRVAKSKVLVSTELTRKVSVSIYRRFGARKFLMRRSTFSFSSCNRAGSWPAWCVSMSFDVNQGCSRHSYAEILVVGSLSNIFLTRSFAESDTEFQSAGSKVRGYLSTLRKISLLLSPSKGG